jgi:predicted GIY-YIG superfamily endonuclease
VYLLHFSQAFHHAQHYLGFTDNLGNRLEAHRSGQGARLIEVITEAGLTFEVARTWQGNRKLERRLKNQKKSPRLCPICQQQGVKS